MVESKFKTLQYTAEQIVESAGAVLFDPAAETVCLIRQSRTGEWLLPKGRREVSEHRRDAAIREVQEETGYACRLLLVTLTSRAPAQGEREDCDDVPRFQQNSSEPFMTTIREVKIGEIKIIYWYIAVIDWKVPAGKRTENPIFEARLFDYKEASKKLTFDEDRFILEKAVHIYLQTREGETRHDNSDS